MAVRLSWNQLFEWIQSLPADQRDKPVNVMVGTGEGGKFLWREADIGNQSVRKLRNEECEMLEEAYGTEIFDPFLIVFSPVSDARAHEPSSN